MEDVPQPSDSPYEVGDEVRIYLGENDTDGQHHGKTGTVTDVLQDDLGVETGRQLDSYSYQIEVNGDTLDPRFRHHDLVPETG